MPISRHRFAFRAETALLIGMILVAASLFLPWTQQKADLSGYQAIALIPIKELTLLHTGFQTTLWLPLTVCAVLCASTLLWNVTVQNRLALGISAGAGGLACVVIALTHFALLPGLLLGLGGGILLLIGAMDRYSRIPPIP